MLKNLKERKYKDFAIFIYASNRIESIRKMCTIFLLYIFPNSLTLALGVRKCLQKNINIERGGEEIRQFLILGYNRTRSKCCVLTHTLNQLTD